jgi:hypothetical protein
VTTLCTAVNLCVCDRSLFEEDAPSKAQNKFWADVKEQFIKLLQASREADNLNATNAAEKFESMLEFSSDPATEPLAQGEERSDTDALWFRVGFPGRKTVWLQNVSASSTKFEISREQWCKIVSHVWQEACIDKLWCSLSKLSASGDAQATDSKLSREVLLNLNNFGESNIFDTNVQQILQIFGLSTSELNGDRAGLIKTVRRSKLQTNGAVLIENFELLVLKVLATVSPEKTKSKEQLSKYCKSANLTKLEFHTLLCFLQTVPCQEMVVTTYTDVVDHSVSCQRIQDSQRPRLKPCPGDLIILESELESKVKVEMTLIKGMQANNADEQILLGAGLDRASFPSKVDWEQARQLDSIDVTGMDGFLRFAKNGTNEFRDGTAILCRHNASDNAARGQTISFELPAHKADQVSDSEWKIGTVDDGVSVEVFAEAERKFVQGENIYVLSEAKNVVIGKGQARYFNGSCFIILQEKNGDFSPLHEGQPVHVCNQEAMTSLRGLRGNIDTSSFGSGSYPQKPVTMPGIGTKKIPVTLTLSLDVVGLTSQQFVHMRRIYRVGLFLVFVGLVASIFPLLWWRYRLEAGVQLAPSSPVTFEIQNCDVRFENADSLQASVQMGQHEGSHWSATRTSIQALRPSSSHIGCLLTVGVPSNSSIILPPMTFKVRRKSTAKCVLHPPEYSDSSSPMTSWNRSSWNWNHTSDNTSSVLQACSGQVFTEYESDAVTIKGSELLDFGSNSLKILASDTHVDVQLKHVRADSVTVLVGTGQIELEDMTISNRSVVSLGRGDVLITTYMPNVTLAYDTNMAHQCVAANRVREESFGVNSSEVVLYASTDIEELSADTNTGSRHISIDLIEGALYFSLVAPTSNPSTANSTSTATEELQVLEREISSARFTTLLDVQAAIRDWIAEAPTLDHVAYIEMHGPGQQKAGRWMFTTNNVYQFVSPWVLSVLSGGLLTPRRKFVSARIFPTECPYRKGWQADDITVLAAVTTALSNALELGATEALVLLQEDAATKFIFSNEGEKIRIKMTDSPELVAAILFSVGLSGFAACLLGLAVYWFGVWGARNFHKSSRSRKVHRRLGANKTDLFKDKDLMIEHRRTAASNGRHNDDDDQLPGPIELLMFTVEESVQTIRLKVAKLLMILAREPKQGRAIQPRNADERVTSLDLPQSRNLTRMDIVGAKRAKHSSISMPHPLQIHWMLTSKLMAQFENSLRLFVEYASANPTSETGSEFYTSDEPIKLEQFASAYHSFCFHNSKNIEGIVVNTELLEAEGIELVQQQSEELIGLRLLPAKPDMLQTSNGGNFLSAFIEYRCHLSNLETDRASLDDFMNEFDKFVRAARQREMEELARTWNNRDKDLRYW